MTTSLGWIEFSQAALRRMQSELDQSEKGVLDEVGVLGIHAAYADRFFPGTSVLHTRARYLFFVPWQYLTLARTHGGATPGEARAELNRLHLWLAQRLNERENRGVIGGTLTDDGRVPKQTPNLMYWPALEEFGLYRGPGPSEILRRWGDLPLLEARVSARGEEAIVPELEPAQFDVPAPPQRWGRKKALREEVDFNLTRGEAEHLWSKLKALQHRNRGEALLGHLARDIKDSPAELSARFWEDSYVKRSAARCGEADRLRRAGIASAVSAFIRGIYGALVEQQRNSEAHPETGQTTVHLDDLVDLCCGKEAAEPSPELGEEVAPVSAADFETARRFKRADFEQDGIPGPTLALMSHVTARLRDMPSQSDESAVSTFLLDPDTYKLFMVEELRRKGARRARLGLNGYGEELRRSFGDKDARLYPVTYHWRQVRTLLEDIKRGLAS